ncbi:conjugal transfer protein [Streptococcus mutans]
MKLKKVVKAVLKKKKKKDKHELRVVSQRKMNTIFIGILTLTTILPCLYFGLGIYSSLTKKDTAVKLKQVSDVDYRLQMFLDSYVWNYFTFPDNSKEQQEQDKKLEEFYNFKPEENSQGQIKTVMYPDSSRLQSIKGNVATYRVTYKVGKGDNTQTVTVNFCMQYGGKNGKYYITSLPWFEAVQDFKDGKADKHSQELKFSAKDNLSESNHDKLDDFIKLFFDNYTTSQKNLDLISNGLKAIKGATYKSLDYSYYKKHKDGKVTAYVQVTFEIAGVTHSENFTFELSKKGDSFFVDKLKHTIPVDYAKGSKNGR